MRLTIVAEDSEIAVIRPSLADEADNYRSRVACAAFRIAQRESGLSARKLASLIGVSKTTLHRWNRGETSPNEFQLLGLLVHLKLLREMLHGTVFEKL